MKKRIIFIIIFIISVIGLVIIQYRYLNIGLNLAQVRFNQNIGQTIKIIKTDLSDNNQLTFLLGKAITNDDTYFKTNMDSLRDASNYFLTDFLETRLLENGIKTDFSYKIYVKDTSLFLNSDNYLDEGVKLKKYPIELQGYLPNSINKKVILELQFQKINEYFLFQLSGLTIPSLIFLAAIIFVVIWVLKSFYWQQSVITMTNDFINNLTHELKTPVFSIGLATKMLQQQENERSKTYLEIIRNQNERLKEHIDKVLQLASLESKQSALQLVETDFYPPLKKLCEEFSLISEMEDVNFSYEIGEEILMLKCDPLHLANAIHNLLDNAKKYCKESPKVFLKTEIKNKKLYIIVEDNGIGIDKKDQKNIFKKHYRVSQGNLYLVKGYGLGLSYVKKIINLHKGSIELVSALNKGTKIIVKLPLVK
ncbi:MAG: two-component sensor histidine kinase [Bacteroidetes bacterium HGW-Bacteroidetes-3]|nr:MAG: two-component sensor histidine kinase [Bacteroidetes bacterium HGW-Bacteroidetes-3]